MYAINVLKNEIIDRLSFVKVSLSEKETRIALLALALFNALGMPLELIILRDTTVPRWPEYLSIAIGILVFILAYSERLPGKRGLFIATIINTAAVSFALYSIYSNFGIVKNLGLPFQASKLGALIAGSFAPNFWVGAICISLHAVSSAVQYVNFPPEVQFVLGYDEPWATIAFGMAGIFILIHRMQLRQLQAEAQKAQAETESVRLLAEEFLRIRDQMNSPVQAIEIATALLKKRDPQSDTILDLESSCQRLRDISQSLKKHEDKIQWKSGRGGLGQPN